MEGKVWEGRGRDEESKGGAKTFNRPKGTPIAGYGFVTKHKYDGLGEVGYMEMKRKTNNISSWHNHLR